MSLDAFLKKQIEHSGPVSLSVYMNLALGHPEYGYYMTRDPFGTGGDFTTAPEISQMFGELLGAWIVDTWMKLSQSCGSLQHIYLVEGGPGRGTLMADALRATRKMIDFHDHMSLYLIETSPYLIERQREKLADHDPVHIMTLDDLPDDAPIIFVANELLDALPIHQLEKIDGTWCEKVVGVKDGALSLGHVPASEGLVNAMPDHIRDGDGGLFEISPARAGFVEKLAARMTAQKGAGLLIDYGHGTSACGDTLQAVKDHAFVPVLETPGEADITSHVDFDALRRVLAAFPVVSGFKLATQRDFLLGLGLKERAEALQTIATEAQQENIKSGYDRLTDPDQMGSLFKVMGFSSPFLPLAGLTHEIL